MQRERFHTSSDDVRIWYGLTGANENTPLILCDGIACDGFIWPHLMDCFAPGRPILRWHYRGHGRTGAPDDSDALSLQHLIEDLKGIVDEVGLQPAVVAGHSMGVQVALEFYRHFPESVKGLALICGSYGRPLSTFQGTDLGEKVLPYLQALIDRAPRVSKAIWSRLLPTNLTFRIAQRAEINPKRARRAEFFPYLEHVSRMDPAVFLGMLSHAAEHTAWDLLPTIDVPVLVIGGDSDGFTPASLSSEMAERIPGGELFLLPGGTHTAPIEFPEAVNARFKRFFADHGL